LRSVGEAALESDLPADLITDAPATLVRDAPRQRARCDAPWLQEDRTAECRQRRRNARRFARAGRRDDYGASSTPNVFDDFADVLIDRERRLH